MRKPFLAIGLAVPALAVILPPSLADRAADRFLADSKAVAAATLPLGDPIGIEIIRNVRHRSDLYDLSGVRFAFHGYAAWFDLYKRLLVGGKVASFRIVLRDDAFDNTATRTKALFVAASGATCVRVTPDLGGRPGCLFFARGHGIAADLTLEHEDVRTWWADQAPNWPLLTIGMRSAIARAFGRGVPSLPGHTAEAPDEPSEGRVVFHALQPFQDRPNGIISFDFGELDAGGGGGGGGLSLGRSRRATDPINPAAPFATKGFLLCPQRPSSPKAAGPEANIFISPPPDAQDAAYLASMLATGPEDGAIFSYAFAAVVTDWHDRLRCKAPMTATDRSIFCASLRSARIETLFWSDQVIAKHGITCI